MPYPFRSLPAPCVFAAALTAGLALLPARTQACTYAEVVLQASYPRYGAVDVPTNAVLFLYGPDLSSADDLRLIDATSGEGVPFEVQAAPSGLDLTPLDALAPNRKYQLQLPAQSPDPVLEFSTDSLPVAPASALPAPKFDATVFDYFLGSCGLKTGLCLQVPEQPGTTLEVRVGEEVLMDSGAPWPLSRAYGLPIGDFDCVEVRLRDATGQRSEPSVACGAAVRRVELEGDDFNQGVNCANYTDYVKASGPPAGLGPDGRPLAPVSPRESPMSPEPQLGNARDVTYAGDEATARGSGAAAGCALAPAGSAAPSLAGLGLALAAGLAARRRGRR